uniref:Uncharacterized protein n=1 Tax=Ixodes ricinus TaxID=34613 RepID=A0A6B0U203_IXORI
MFCIVSYSGFFHGGFVVAATVVHKNKKNSHIVILVTKTVALMALFCCKIQMFFGLKLVKTFRIMSLKLS